MQLQGGILSEEEKTRVHQESLRILREIGLKFHSDKALKLLERSGAQVNWDDRIARIPAELVEHALQTTPKTLVLGARNPTYDYPMPSPFTRYSMDGTSAFALDFETGERRYGVRKDIENGVRIFQQMDMGIMAWPPTCASDTPAGSRVLHEFFTMLRYCSKHGEHELHRVEEIPYFIAGLKAILGSEEAIKARKICSVTYCTVAPLVHDGPMCDTYMELGQYEIPIMIMPMPVTGTTGPASLFANICLANAEALSTVVIFQLANPGTPMIYSSASGAVDFSTGNFLAGTPEAVLQSAAIAEMGRFYNLPNTATGCISDAKQAGPEAVIEKIITILPNLLVRADLIVGFGEVESSQLLVLEQILVDNEIAHLCQRLLEGVDTSDEKNLFDDIASIGPGGHFLKAKSTRQATRSGEFYIPKLIDRHSFESWVNLGRPTMYAKAREKVQEILEGPVVDPLPDDAAGKLDEVLLAADQELKE